MIDIHQIENALDAELSVKELHNIYGNVTSLIIQNNGSFEVVADIDDDMDELIAHINYLVELEQDWKNFKVVKATTDLINKIDGISGEFVKVEFGVYQMRLKLKNYIENIFYGGDVPTLTIELEHDLNKYNIILKGIDENHKYAKQIVSTLKKMSKSNEVG